MTTIAADNSIINLWVGIGPKWRKAVIAIAVLAVLILAGKFL